MVSLTALALVALPLVSSAAASVAGAAHYSHPRRADLAVAHGRAAVRYRSLPRTGRRLAKRGSGGSGTEATVKCLTAHTFALCDGERCTDMGPVAAGTMCKDGAITWDTTSEASAEDSSAASASYAEIPSAAVQLQVIAPTTSSSEEVETLSLDKVLANNVAVTATSAASAAVSTSVDTVQLNVDSGSSDDSSDSDDWECDAEEDDTASSSTTSWTAASSTVDAVQLIQISNAATTTTSQAAQTTTTSSAPAQTSSSSGGSSSGTTYSGRATYYYQYGVAGSCGDYASDSDYVIALSYTQVDGGSHCGQRVSIRNTENGKTVEATVADTCPGCAWGAIDLSEGAFLQLGTLDQGVLSVEWSYIS